MRPARPAEAGLLSRLALRSKATWGYSRELMDAFAVELSTTPEQIANPRFRFAVAEVDGVVADFYALERLSAEELELDALFVEPDRIGTGIGRTLLAHARRAAAELGGRTLVVQGEPHADVFYRAAGALRIGERESGSVSGRFLPLYALPLAGDDGLSPGTRGTYILLIELAERSTVRIGRIGTADLAPGLYAYVGSALGPGGLAARLKRHAAATKRMHWHVDHLLGLTDRARLTGALVAEDGVRHECPWAAWLESRAFATVERFGASDCHCRGHLFLIATEPHAGGGTNGEARDRFVAAAWDDLGAHSVRQAAQAGQRLVSLGGDLFVRAEPLGRVPGPTEQ